VPKHNQPQSKSAPQPGETPETKLPPASLYTVRLGPETHISREEFEARRADRDGRGELVTAIAREVVTSGFLWKLRRLNPERSIDLLRTDALIAIDRLVRSYDPERCVALDRYVARYLRNRVIDLWREDGRSPGLPLHPAPEDIAATSIASVGRAAELLGLLSPLQRRIVSARMRGSHYAAIACDLKISESALYSELRAIRSRDERSNGIEGKRTDFERFITHLLRPETDPSKLSLSEYARSPEFFARYLTEMRNVFRFKRTVRASYRSGDDILGPAVQYLVRHIEERYGAIDRIPAAYRGPISRLLDSPKNIPAILRNLHARGACSLSPPSDPGWHLDACRTHQRSPYFEPTVVGSARARANIHHHITVVAPTLVSLDDPRIVRHLARLLDLPAERQALGAYCIRNRVLSSTLPASLLTDDRSASPFKAVAPYLDSAIVGERAAKANLQLAVQRTFPSLDAISRDRMLSRFIGCGDSLVDLIRHLAAPNFLGATPPPGTTLLRPDGRITRYADARCVGPDAHSNFDRLFRAAFSTVDDLPWKQPALARALGAANNLAAIASAAIERTLLPATIPDGHPWYRRGGTPSRYFSPSVVGAERAIRSLRTALEPLVPKLDEMLDVEETARLLGVAPSERAVARRCITLGITAGTAEPTTPIVRSNGELSLHLDPRVRRRSLAINDLRMIVHAQQLTLEDLVKIPQLSLLLRCEPSRSGLIAGLAEKSIEPHLGSVPTQLEFNRALHPAFDRSITPPVRWQSNMRTYLSATYSSLDQLQRDRLLAEALGCPNTARDIASAVVANRMMQWRAPLGFSLFGVPGGSFYVDEDVMGDSRRVDLNIRRSLRGTITTLDDVYQNEALASALRCAKSATAIAATLVERRILSSELPPGHPFTLGHVRSRYFEQAVVGLTQVHHNIALFLRREAPTLDDLPMIDALCNTLNVERRRLALAQFVVHFGLVDWRIPSGHNVSRAGGSLYLNAEVIGAERVRSNIQAHLIDRYGGNLDAVPLRSKSLASALGVPNNKRAFVEAILARGILPPVPPPGYVPNGTNKSVYLDPTFVGAFTAARNRQ